MYTRHRTTARGVLPMGMTELEIEAVRKFSSTYGDEINPLPIAKVLRKNCIIDEIIFEDISRMQRRLVPRKIICEALVNETTGRCSLEQLIKTLYDNDFKWVAGKLFICYRECQNNMAVLRVDRADTSSRRKIGEFFKHIKQLVHERAFNNAYTDVQNLGKNMRRRIYETTDPIRKMQLCDQFVALKAAEMDALTNIARIVSKDHPGYLEIGRFVNSTSNPALSRVILYGRQSDVLSTTGDFQEAEDLMKNALVSADTSGSCVEVTDMLYKNVVVKLSKFERNPYDEELRKSILYEADRGLWTLQDEKEDLRIFWTKLFLLRMAFAHLGIGKFCHMVKNYVPDITSIVEAERILQLEPLKDLEHRRQMFIAVAKARLNEWKGNMDSAVDYLKKARQLAQEGKYAEDAALEEYELFLTTDPWQVSTTSRSSVRGCENLGNTVSPSSPILESNTNVTSLSDSIPPLSMHVSPSNTDEETHITQSSSSERTDMSTDFTLSSAPQLTFSFPSSASSNESCEHLNPLSLQVNQSESSSVSQSDQVLELNSDSFPSMEHLRLSSFENTQNN